MHLGSALSKENRAGFFLYPFLVAPKLHVVWKLKGPSVCHCVVLYVANRRDGTGSLQLCSRGQSTQVVES